MSWIPQHRLQCDQWDFILALRAPGTATLCTTLSFIVLNVPHRAVRILVWGFWFFAFLFLFFSLGQLEILTPEACAGFLEGGARAHPLVGGARSWSFGGQGCVKRHVKRWLWAQEVFRQPICRCVGLCSCPVGYLAWDVPPLEPTGCRVAWSLGANNPSKMSVSSHSSCRSLLCLPQTFNTPERATAAPYLSKRLSKTSR